MKFGCRVKFDSIGNTLTVRILSGGVSDQVIATELYGNPHVPLKRTRDKSVIEIDPGKLLCHWRPYFGALAGSDPVQSSEGSVLEIGGMDVEQLGDQANFLRKLYQQGDEQILASGRKMLAAGKGEEEVARWVVKERNTLKVTIRERGPALFRKIAEWRNIKEYGNPVGPSYEDLVSKLGTKSPPVPPEKINITIIENVKKTSLLFNAAGDVMEAAGTAAGIAGFVMMATEDSPVGAAPLPKSQADEIEIERVRLRLGIPAGANIDTHGHLKPSFYLQIPFGDMHGGDESDAEDDEIAWWLGFSCTYHYGGVEWTVPGR
jgi:hypothetical protein